MDKDENKKHPCGGIDRRAFIKRVAIGGTVLASAPHLLTQCEDDPVSPDVDPNGQHPIFRVNNVPVPSGMDQQGFRHQGVDKLMELMSTENYKIYKSQTVDTLSGPEGIIGSDDVVVIKVNNHCEEYGSVNNDVLQGFIQLIVDHPDGFTGEVVIVDKILCNPPYNSEDNTRDLNVIADYFKPEHKVSMHLLSNEVYAGNINDDPDTFEVGYVFLGPDDDPEYGRVSYPCLETEFGTQINMRYGVWEGSSYNNDKLKLIGYSVIKNHFMMGGTNVIKNFFGITNIGTLLPDLFTSAWQRSHDYIYTNGLLGRWWKYVRKADFFLVDGIRVVTQPSVGPFSAGESSISKTNLLLGGFEPVNLDYYSFKRILYPLGAELIPCEGIGSVVGHGNCIVDGNPPCVRTGKCERVNPDLNDERPVQSEWATMLGILEMENVPPLNVLKKTLETTSQALYGKNVIKDYHLVETSL